MPDQTPHSKDRPAESCATSVGSLQEFHCTGLPLDSPIIEERERLKHAHSGKQQDDTGNVPPPAE